MLPKTNFRKLSASLFILAAFVHSCSKETVDPKIDVVEGIFVNELYAASGEDWIELYNQSTEEKDVGGYKIFVDVTQKYPIPNGTVIGENGFLVLICDKTATGLHTNFKLDANGETIYLENTAGKIIDIVKFPTLNDGDSFGRYPDGSDHLGTSGNPSRGISNGEVQAPVISAVTKNILVPKIDDDVVIKAEVQSTFPVAMAKLFYRYDNGAFTETSMVLSSGAFEATIPALNNTGEVEYYISVANTAGLITVSPFEAPDKTYHFLLNTDELPLLRINEFMAQNKSCCPDTDGGVEEFDDWIEIYNAGQTPVNIGDMFMSDDKTDPFKSKIKNSNAELTTIAPGGFLLIWADEQGTQGDLHMNFKLSGSGEDVGIFYKDGRTIDVYTFGAQKDDVSMGRQTDGGAVWKSFSAATPGKPNAQ
jgi:hypothetical protein